MRYSNKQLNGKEVRTESGKLLGSIYDVHLGSVSVHSRAVGRHSKDLTFKVRKNRIKRIEDTIVVIQNDGEEELYDSSPYEGRYFILPT